MGFVKKLVKVTLVAAAATGVYCYLTDKKPAQALDEAKVLAKDLKNKASDKIQGSHIMSVEDYLAETGAKDIVDREEAEISSAADAAVEEGNVAVEDFFDDGE